MNVKVQPARKSARKRRSGADRRVSARWLIRRLALAHNVLANPKATDPQRRLARCLLNRTVGVRGALEPIPQMKRGLDVDKQRTPLEAPKPRRPRKASVQVLAAAAVLATAGTRS